MKIDILMTQVLMDSIEFYLDNAAQLDRDTIIINLTINRFKNS